VADNGGVREVGTAGGSAQVRFESGLRAHRRTLEQARSRLLKIGSSAVLSAAALALLGYLAVAAWIVFVGLALMIRVVAPPEGLLAWRVGAEGEEETARALRRLPAGFIVLHDRLIPGSRANIDHIVIGPPGVAIVETKSYSGRLYVRHGEVFVNGRRRTAGTVAEARREALAVQVALASELERRKLRVRAVLCVHRADLPLLGASAQGVAIVSGRGLRKALTTGRWVLSDQEVCYLGRLVIDRLPSALASMPQLYERDWTTEPETPPEMDATAVAPNVLSEDEERYMPPVRRDHLRIAREAQARATPERTYWTGKGLWEGKAPDTLAPREPRQHRTP
jgi:hypothetical protein